MPNYYNPYTTFYPATYQSPAGYSAMMPAQQPAVQSYAQAPAQKAMEWVDGEIGARTFQQPSWLPANTPIPLWDSTDTYIYIKSWNPMGIPNPIQKIPYTLPDQQSTMLNLPQGQSGNNEPQQPLPDMSQYVTKQDLEQFRHELRSSMANRNQSRSQGGDIVATGTANRGENR